MKMGTIFLFTLAYLMGSIPFGKLASNLYGIDIQQRGSGNIGFANVRRVVGWPAAILTQVGDILKGVIPTLIALMVGGPGLAMWTGLLAMLGHIFPVWLNFRGGKGVATGLGVVIVIQPIAALAGGAIYVIGGVLGFKSSHSSLVGTVVVLLLTISLSPALWWQFLLLAGLITWKLRHNMRGTVPNYG